MADTQPASSEFKSTFAENIFKNKYALTQAQTWHEKARSIVLDVCGKGYHGQWDYDLLSKEDQDDLVQLITDFKFMPGGRYIYYAGRNAKFWNNCYLLQGEEDTREEWGALAHRAMLCLSAGGGIGVDYSVFRPEGQLLSRTGGQASGPIPLMKAINEIGRNVMQGGSRRSAIYASLNWQHADIPNFLKVKNWFDYAVAGTDVALSYIKEQDFNFPCPLDMTNISVNYNDAWMNKDNRHQDPIFVENCRQALMTGEPGFSFNFGDKENETLRNAPVAADTRVLTSDGYQTVGDIVGEPVTLWTGQQWAKTTFKKTYDNVETVEVTLSNGRSIVCDPDHPFLVWSKQGSSRVPACELEIGSSLCCDLPTDEPRTPLEGEEYGYGFVWGDGSILSGRGDIQVFQEYKKRCFSQAVGGLGGYVKSNPNRAYFRSPYGAKPFFISKSFLAGWFDADGSYSRGLLRLSSKEKDKLLAAQEAFDNMGIKSVVREDGKCNFGTDNPMYTLQVYKDSHNRFRGLIPTLRVIPDMVDRCRQQNIKVLDVTPSNRTEDVYCCDVGVPEHSFMAEGVLVSNCCEVSSEDDSDVCNLGSLNLSAFDSIEDFKDAVRLASKFLVCGTMRAELPYDKVYDVREKNRRLGLGLMGIHEWLVKRGYKYEVTDELHKWLAVYRDESERSADEHCDRFFLSKPAAYRAIAPTGTIGILASTTTGIEPLYAVAFKRRYLVDGTKWKYEYVVDNLAQQMVNDYGVNPEKIETASSLASNPEKRIKFQADVQDYVDMAISSTINLPKWGTEHNNDDLVDKFAKTLAHYAPRLRGFTSYPDGARGGQPITTVPYEEAIKRRGVVYEEHQEDQCKGGVCGI